MNAVKLNRASALIFAVVILAVLSGMAVYFITLALLNSQAAGNNSESIRAQMIAQAAIEYAISQIPYATMDVGYSDPRKKHAFQDAPLFDKDTNKRLKEPIEIPAENAQKPSFCEGVYNKGPLHFSYTLRKKGVGSTHTEYFATLKLIDANALYNLNSPFDPGNPEQYPFLINLLITSGYTTDRNIAIAMAKKIHARKPYRKIDELLHLLTGVAPTMNRQQLNRFKCYVTTASWGYDHAIKHSSACTLTSIQKETRYPININFAPLPVLYALLWGIKGNRSKGESLPPAINNTIDKNLAEKLAQTIRKRIRPDGSDGKPETDPSKWNPFKTWDELEDYLRDPSQSGLAPREADLVFAAIYPYVRLNKKDADFYHFREYDKFDVVVGTSDVCLFSPGVYNIESYGRAVAFGEKLVGNAKIIQDVRLWKPHLKTTQTDFASERESPDTGKNTFAWTAIKPRVPAKHAATSREDPHPDLGTIFAKNPQENLECKYWNHASEKRPDGSRMRDPDTAEAEGEWDNSKIEFWFKPGYDFDVASETPCDLAEWHTKSGVPGGCWAVTRCGYDKLLKSLNEASEDGHYLRLSRTYVGKVSGAAGYARREDPGSPKIIKETRIFYGQTLHGDAKERLRQAGRSLYGDIVDQLNVMYEGTKRSFMPVMGEETKLGENFYKLVYSSFACGYDYRYVPKTTCQVKSQIFTWDPWNGGQWQFDVFEVLVRFMLSDAYSNIARFESKYGNYDLNLPKAYWENIFTGKPELQKIDRDEKKQYQHEGAIDINEFPHKPIQTTYRYSRSEYRIRIDLKQGYWYHFHGEWDKMLVTRFEVRSNARMEDGGDSTLYTGALDKNSMGGPLHIWLWNHNDGKALKNGKRYLSDKCTIYQSTYDGSGSNTGDQDRYRDTNLEANFSCDKAKIDRPYARFGTLNWTCFIPKCTKKEADPPVNIKTAVFKVNIDTNSSYACYNSDGSFYDPDGSGSACISNSLFDTYLHKDQLLYYRLEFANIKESSNPKYATAPFQTCVFDSLTFYFLIKPEILNHKVVLAE